MFGKTLRAKQARIDGVLRISPHAYRAAVPDTNEHPATDRAVTASRGDPSVWNFLFGSVPHNGITGVRILFFQDVQSELPLQTHATAFPADTYEAAMFFGTTLTKKTYRPRTSPANAMRRETNAPAQVGTSTGRRIPPKHSSAPLPKNEDAKAVESRRADAWSSKESDAVSQKNLPALFSTWPAAATTIAMLSQRRSPIPRLATSKGPSSIEVRKNPATVCLEFHAGRARTR